MTDLEDGIKVWITYDEREKLEKKTGFLSYKNYPDEYKKIAFPNEIGRFSIFRIIYD